MLTNHLHMLYIYISSLPRYSLVKIQGKSQESTEEGFTCKANPHSTVKAGYK